MPSSRLSENFYGERNIWIECVDEVVAVVQVRHIYRIGIKPVGRPVVWPWIDHLYPIVSVLESGVPTDEGHWIFIDTEDVRRTKVCLVALLRDAIAAISATLLPGVMLRLPIVHAVALPVSLLFMSRSRASLFRCARRFGGWPCCLLWPGRLGRRWSGGPLLRLGWTDFLLWRRRPVVFAILRRTCLRRVFFVWIRFWRARRRLLRRTCRDWPCFVRIRRRRMSGRLCLRVWLGLGRRGLRPGCRLRLWPRLRPWRSGFVGCGSYCLRARCWMRSWFPFLFLRLLAMDCSCNSQN